MEDRKSEAKSQRAKAKAGRRRTAKSAKGEEVRTNAECRVVEGRHRPKAEVRVQKLERRARGLKSEAKSQEPQAKATDCGGGCE
jgi:hypothetical protein